MSNDDVSHEFSELLKAIAPETISEKEKPDSQTQMEMHANDEERKKVHLLNFQQNIELRREYSGKIFWFVVVYLSVVMILLALVAGCQQFELSDAVLITLLSTTTINVIGLFLIVIKYLFSSRA